MCLSHRNLTNFNEYISKRLICPRNDLLCTSFLRSILHLHKPKLHTWSNNWDCIWIHTQTELIKYPWDEIHINAWTSFATKELWISNFWKPFCTLSKNDSIETNIQRFILLKLHCTRKLHNDTKPYIGISIAWQNKAYCIDLFIIFFSVWPPKCPPKNISFSWSLWHMRNKIKFGITYLIKVMVR